MTQKGNNGPKDGGLLKRPRTAKRARISFRPFLVQVEESGEGERTMVVCWADHLARPFGQEAMSLLADDRDTTR